MSLRAKLGLVNIAFIEFSNKLNLLLDDVELPVEDERTLAFAMEDVSLVLSLLNIPEQEHVPD